jgi:NAD-dependent dihydropyrimidine dehydrogenase PreA subunit
MCQFCVQHGDGEKWYLNAANYVADLESDLDRRGFIIDFVQDFDARRSRSLTWLRQLEKSGPRVLEATVKNRAHKSMKENHYGQPVPIEECDRIFDFATSIVRLPCICRTYAGKAERGLCLAVTAMPMDDVLDEAFEGFEMGPDISKLEHLTKDQAMELLSACEHEGLMHSVWTFHTPFIGAICNCDLESGCMAMTITLTHDTQLMWRGESVAALDGETCTNCGDCVERCPFDAISARSNGTPVTLRQEDCWGCGVCRSACSTGSIALEPREHVPAVAGVW